MRERTVAFLPVRLTSTRLPGKHLLPIGGRPLLSWVLKRLRDCPEVDEAVICAPDEAATDGLVPLAREEGAPLFRFPGDVNNVVGRLTAAARAHSAGLCVLASGDCPLLSSGSLGCMIRALREDPPAWLAGFQARDGAFPLHEGMDVARWEAWEAADRLSDTPALREHLFPVFRLHPERFPGLRTALAEDDPVFYRPRFRLSVDTPEDLAFHQTLHDRLRAQSREYGLAEALALLEREPELLAINAGVCQKALDAPTGLCLLLGIEEEEDARLAEQTARLLTSRHGLGVRVLTWPGASSPLPGLARADWAPGQPLPEGARLVLLFPGEMDTSGLGAADIPVVPVRPDESPEALVARVLPLFRS